MSTLDRVKHVLYFANRNRRSRFLAEAGTIRDVSSALINDDTNASRIGYEGGKSSVWY